MKTLLIVLLLLVAPFSLAQDFPLKGSGLADGVLQKDTYNALQAALPDMLVCPLDKIVITTEFQHYLSDTGVATKEYKVDGERIASPWVEYWTAKGCANTQVLVVKFTPDSDPHTGTSFSVKLK